MKRSSILFFVIIIGFVIWMVFDKSYLSLILYIATFIIFKYVEVACEKKLPLWKPIRKFMFKYDYKPYAIKTMNRQMPFLSFQFLIALELDENSFIELGFKKATDEALNYIIKNTKQRLEKTVQELILINNMTEEERLKYYIQLTKDAEIEDNENDLDRFHPGWRNIINN